VDTHTWAYLRGERGDERIENKRMILHEQAYLNTAMQRIANNHTCTWTWVTAKCEMCREATEYWSTSILMWQFMYSCTIPKHGGLQGTDRVITTYHLPLNRGAWNAFTCSFVPRHHARIQRNYRSPPWDSDPTDQQVKDMGTPKGMMIHHINIALILLINMIWKTKHKVLYTKIIT